MKITNVPEEGLEKFWGFQIKYLGNKSLNYIKKFTKKTRIFSYGALKGMN